ESSWAAHKMRDVYGELMANLKAGDTATANMEKFDPSTWEADVKGVGYGEAPRGALGHWVHIKDTKIKNYQCVVPSTWNAGPRNENDEMGPYEASLMGNPVADPEQPLEVLRTVHSFDPCIACAIHLVDTEQQEIIKVKAL
ncbi:MAG: nickel-dependent hydrogenase large subunit, partial [Sedimenticola sp.]|nr:nickel-dependent hydrogenase large subunit [Sedimenticola sp.]